MAFDWENSTDLQIADQPQILLRMENAAALVSWAAKGGGKGW